MIILGLTHPISWNNAACIMVDGNLIAFAEEERFTRKKHAPRTAPIEAMKFCLDRAGVTLDQVDHIAIGFDSAFTAAGKNLFAGDGLSANLNQAVQWMKQGQKYEKMLPLDGVPRRKIHFINHHLSHAASTFYASGFEKANIISLDGSGGSESGIVAVGRGSEIEILKRVTNRGSWGLMYELVTDAVGFMRHSGEGKTMGLASYGTPDPNGLPFVDWDADIPTIIPDERKAFMSKLTPRKKGEPITDEHRNLAATLQFTLEQAGKRMAEYLYEQTGYRNLCMAGGTALNCSMNGKLAHLPIVDNIYVQPASHDAGTALGAALEVHKRVTGVRPNFKMDHAYWGADYSNDEIAAALSGFDAIRYHKSEDVCAETAQLLHEGYIVGWHQGRFEVGPRALGARSILGNPTKAGMKDLINKKVKNREPWRPFAPSMLEEEIGRYIDNPVPSPFMILAFNTREDARSEIVEATHVDGTCRPQTVMKSTNPRYWNMINAFKELSGVPVVLNTSFNVAGQPIVNTPEQAISTFLRCGMDKLAIGDYIVHKVDA